MSEALQLTDAADHLVLGVDRSASLRRWVWRDGHAGDGPARDALAMSQRAGISDMLARILCARGVDLGTLGLFLDPRLRAALPDPSCLKGLDQAAERLARAVRAGETVGIFGDYDVDGACSTALLTETLRALNLRVLTHIPDRLAEGYGPNAPALTRMVEAGASLLICADCGTAARDVLDPLRAQADIVVLDHHKPDGGLLPNAIVVNPNRLDCDSGLSAICATAVAFLTMVGMVRDLRREGWFAEGTAPDLMASLDLVALATICDVMPLTGLNRALVSQGLRVMARGARLGLSTLASVVGVQDAPTAMTCGFAFGPRINAGGRIAQADLGLRLLLSEDAVEARALAERLDEVNRTRQGVESDILRAALDAAEAQCAEGRAALFLHGPSWHPGVVGIVAGRVRERCNRPAFVGALQDGIIKGSARSVPGLDLGAAVIAARQSGLLLTGGGHAMAAGFSLRVEDAEAFHTFMDTRLAAANTLPPQADLVLDGIVSLRGADLGLAQELGRMAPFGAGNEEPLLALAHVRSVHAQRIGRDSNTLRVSLQDENGGMRLRGLAFRAADKRFAALLEDPSRPLLHVAGWLRAEQWQGRDTLSLIIVDVAIA
ncbi:single-stranded-DNA-specific exonuclease RecJ [Tanticharoenia sakaeratensis NBRC 103193]|uniref:Single-stranded-DNA-specific exonuclease RecJ n=2 Tax=Tanticharoenia TaxID=444052 RepID=A0A0D6MM36_9PROT|nr:single-stranded-DNA-specific exonuclease RecJ [Tanticharoenia sakaeratensis NBRC 103193]GBQ24265.1 single-stranded-DNA-specific exonuclease RecJ [Tanticharoenia sakaeratensis NBRC 103193]